MRRGSVFHLVDASPWPILGANVGLMLVLGLVRWFHGGGLMVVEMGLWLCVGCVFFWWRDVVRESSFLGFHTSAVRRGLRIGMVLFILSEVFFFLGFFWAFFHSSLVSTADVGSTWPPYGLEIMDPMAVPLLNTVVLLGSGVFVTYSHYSLVMGDYSGSVLGLFFTLCLGVFFTMLQLMEYLDASFSIADSVYGSVFFMATGFHGFHVLVGSAFLFVCLFRLVLGEFSSSHHVGYECAIWYWHFVDVVWIFLYLSIYWWGSVYAT
uniref:Cytochrome c oxidase subunit 3 n=1 Tax=Halocynthia aurantium TaxID=254849 RepID=A0A7L8Y3P6_HALAU|nr:cytochrome c oxidase subunit III [Halocynthia aurantium]QOI13833.1 cytochrome c oxidase subunit III [Halocynthia aurantium]